MVRPVVGMVLIALIAGLGLAACTKETHPPGEVGTCFQVQPQRDGSLKYNRLPSKQPDLEHCAAALEAMRMKFISMGGSQREIAGAYQGNYLFLQRDGIFTSQYLEAHRYLILVRTNDGRLVIPSAMPQQP